METANKTNPWRALANPNYFMYFGGQGVSLVGTWLQQTTMTWLVYRLTGSGMLLGLVGFSGQLPAFLLAPVAGALTDRWPRHKALVVTQVLATLQALVLGWLSVTGRVAVWHLVALSAFLGAVNAFDITLRQSFVIELVDDPADLGNAIALNSTLVNGARVIGPSVAGFLIPIVGESASFFLNAASYVAVIVALLAMKLKPRDIPVRDRNVGGAIADGFRYAFGFLPIRALLLNLALISFAGMPYMVLLPVFAKEVLGGGASTLGILMAAAGVGSLGAGLHLAGRGTVLGLGRFVTAGSVLFGASLIAFSYSHTLALSMAMLAVSGYAMMACAISSNTILQTLVEDEMRGRVMSIYLMAFMGLQPLGSLVGGWVSDRIGAPAALQVGGLLCVAGGMFFGTRLESVREAARPIYQKKGILPV